MTNASTITARPNKFGAACAECRGWVGEGHGSLTRENNRWVTRHVGACPAPAAPAEAAAPVRAAKGVDAPDLPESRYAVRQDGVWCFYQIDRPVGKWEGWTFMRRLVGAPGEWQKYPVKGEAAAAVVALIREMGARESAAAYAAEHGRCAVCDAMLSDPESIARSMGPICAKRF